MDTNMTMPDSMNMTNSSMGMMAMLPFHTVIGLDTLWFAPWMPMSAGSTFGACVGLFFLGGFYRFLFALRATADLNWLMRSPTIMVRTVSSSSPRSDEKQGSMQDVPELAAGNCCDDAPASEAVDNCCDAPSDGQPQRRIDIPGVPPFSWRIDVTRGLLEGLLSFVGYFLMLAVMVMNAWFFIAIILGIIVGEIAFGRFTARTPLNVHRSC